MAVWARLVEHQWHPSRIWVLESLRNKRARNILWCCFWFVPKLSDEEATSVVVVMIKAHTVREVCLNLSLQLSIHFDVHGVAQQRSVARRKV